MPSTVYRVPTAQAWRVREAIQRELDAIRRHPLPAWTDEAGDGLTLIVLVDAATAEAMVTHMPTRGEPA